MSQRSPDEERSVYETANHSFIIRIWLEEIVEDGQHRWRGHITHVPSGRRRYFVDVDEISRFIASYMTLLGDVEA